MPFTKHIPWDEVEHLRPTVEIPVCKDKAHRPPGHIVLEPGIHEYTCPSCGAKECVVVPKGPKYDTQATVEASLESS